MMKRQNNTSFGVIGLGRFGSALVKTLSNAGKEVIAVDKDEHKVKAIRRYTDYAFVVENLDRETLEETGIQNCETVTICIGETMDVSILTTMLVIKNGNSPCHLQGYQPGTWRGAQAVGRHRGLSGVGHGPLHGKTSDFQKPH